MIPDDWDEPIPLDCQPVGSCDECGCDIYPDEYHGDGLCDQCAWWAEQC